MDIDLTDPDLYRAERYTAAQIAAYKDDNERRIRGAAARADVTIDGHPLKVTLELTADCNLFCRMCEFPGPREQGRGKYDLHMPIETFRMLVPQVFPHARIVNLTVVGEPLMVPYLDEVLNECRRWQTKIEFITNAVLLDQAMINRVGPETACMIVSFDGGTRRTFNRIRVGGDFNLITKNMLLYQRWRLGVPADRRPGFHMACTLMRENIEELPLMVEIAHALGVDRLCASWMISFSDKLAKSSPLRHRALANKCLRAAHVRARELGVDVALPVEFPDVSEAEIEATVMNAPVVIDGPLPHLLTELDILHGRVPDPAVAARLAAAEAADQGVAPAGHDAGEEGLLAHQSREERMQQAQGACAVKAAEPDMPALGPDGQPVATCKFLWNELFISTSGAVAPCCIQGRPIVGNVHQDGLSAIWNNEPMREMRQRLLEGDPVPCCRDCNYNTQQGRGTYREDTFFLKLDRKM